MMALERRVVDALWAEVEDLLPPRPVDEHPLGCHRPRVPDKDVFEAMLFRLVTGCSWMVAGMLGKGGETTLRRRRDEWVAAGVFDRLVERALAGYDRIVGLDLSECAIDGSIHKAPVGGEGTGPSPVDRGKSGWKWSMLTDWAGVPIGWAIEGANRNDMALLQPTLADAAARGYLDDVETLHLDKGYDNSVTTKLTAAVGITDVITAKRRPAGQPKSNTQAVPTKNGSHTLGLRWPVERTNSWLSNFGQLRRNTDRFTPHRLAQFALAVAAILTVKLYKHAKRWNHPLA